MVVLRTVATIFSARVRRRRDRLNKIFTIVVLENEPLGQPGVNVMITISGEFAQFSAKKFSEPML
jgi:hypothetical protein